MCIRDSYGVTTGVSEILCFISVSYTHLRSLVEVILLEEQCEFRTGRSCLINVFVLNQIIEKNREYCVETLRLLFFDSVNVFDMVHRDLLFNILKRRRVLNLW